MGIYIGEVIYSAVKPMYKIYFIIAIGFMLAKMKIFDEITCRGISRSIVTAIMPCLIFTKIVTYIKSSDIKNIGIIVFTALLLFSIGGLVAFALYFLTGAPKRWFGGLVSVGIFNNVNDLPIAYLQTFSKSGIFSEDQVNVGVA